MKLFRRTATETTPTARLRQRVQRCLDCRDPQLALENEALAEVTAVLDEVLHTRQAGGQLNSGALGDVIALHHLRAANLSGSQDAHAFVATAVWIHAVDPAAVAPQVRDYVTQAITAGAATDEPTAVLRALQGHASAVRAAWRRSPDTGLADTFVHAFTRLLDHSDPGSPSYPTALLDLAAAHGERQHINEPQARPEDLQTGIALTDQALTHPHADEATTSRAHQLRAQMLLARLDHLRDPDDIPRAERSLQALIDTAPDQLERTRRHEDLAAFRRQYPR